MNEQRLVASGVPGRRQDRQTAVAEQILVAIEEFSLVLRAERLLRRRHRGLPLVSLHDQGGVGERVDIADMIGMVMRDRNVVNIARLYPDRGKFSDQRLAAGPGLPEWRHSLPLPQGREPIGDPGVPQQIALATLAAQAARVRTIQRAPDN